VISVLKKLAGQRRRLSDLKDRYFTTVCFDETNAQRDGTIRRHTAFAIEPTDLVLSGPHIFVGNPLYKTPRSGLHELPRVYLALPAEVAAWLKAVAGGRATREVHLAD
jgi:hypothetical protein